MILRLTRIIALAALVLALVDAGRLLGAGTSDANPIARFGVESFVLVGGFAVTRLFAAVGMWIRTNWGVPLLFIGTLAELLIFLSGLFRFEIGLVGFGLRLLLLAAASLLLWFAFQEWRKAVHD